MYDITRFDQAAVTECRNAIKSAAAGSSSMEDAAKIEVGIGTCVNQPILRVRYDTCVDKGILKAQLYRWKSNDDIRCQVGHHVIFTAIRRQHCVSRSIRDKHRSGNVPIECAPFQKGTDDIKN